MVPLRRIMNKWNLRPFASMHPNRSSSINMTQRVGGQVENKENYNIFMWISKPCYCKKERRDTEYREIKANIDRIERERRLVSTPCNLSLWRNQFSRVIRLCQIRIIVHFLVDIISILCVSGNFKQIDYMQVLLQFT